MALTCSAKFPFHCQEEAGTEEEKGEHTGYQNTGFDRDSVHHLLTAGSNWLSFMGIWRWRRPCHDGHHFQIFHYSRLLSRLCESDRLWTDNWTVSQRIHQISFVLSVMRHRRKERCTSQRRFGEPRWDFIAWNQQNKTTQLQRRSWNDAGSERVQHKTLRHSKYAYGNHSRTNWLVLKWCLFSGISCEGRRGLMARARLWDEESGSRIWPGYGVLFFDRIFYSLITAYLYSPEDIDQYRW